MSYTGFTVLLNIRLSFAVENKIAVYKRIYIFF